MIMKTLEALRTIE